MLSLRSAGCAALPPQGLGLSLDGKTIAAVAELDQKRKCPASCSIAINFLAPNRRDSDVANGINLGPKGLFLGKNAVDHGDFSDVPSEPGVRFKAVAVVRTSKMLDLYQNLVNQGMKAIVDRADS